MSAETRPCISGCTVESCERPRKYEFYCAMHYSRLASLAEAEPCPTCSPPVRRTVGMVCPTCGKDYAVTDGGVS
jgi:hypothetical protein